MLERDEGRRYVAYPDPLTGGAPWTIGIGHTGPDVHKDSIWTAEQVDAAFARDVSNATAQCKAHFDPWFSLLTEPRRAVLVAMCFQLGIGGLLAFKQTLAAVRDEHYALAADKMKDSAWARQTPKRAMRMAEQMSSGDWA